MKKICLFGLVLSVGFLACKKRGEPDAKICASKDVYKISDTLKMVNCSERSTKQRWVMPDGTKSTDNQVYYVPTGAGNYAFTIYVSDDDFISEYAHTYTAVVK